MSKAAPNGFRANPFYFLFFLYLSANLVALLTLALGQPIKVETEEFTFDRATVAISALALFSSLLPALAVYRASLALTTPRHVLTFGRPAALTLLALQLAYFLFSTYYGINIAGIEDDAGGNALIKLMFSAIQPDLLFLILSVGIKSNRLFWINAITYGVSLAVRGWIGGLYLLALVVLIRNSPFIVNRKKLGIIALLFLAGIIFLPAITSAKWFIRAGGGVSEAMDFLSDFGYFNYFLDSLYYVVNRFQHLGHVTMLAEDSRRLSIAFDVGEFTPYWMDGAPQWLFLRLSGVDIFQLQRYIPSYYFDVNNLAYAVNPGISGWFFALQYKLIFLLFFLFLITLPPAIVILRLAGYRYFLLISCFMLIYLFHGWIGAYVNLVFYLLAFLSLKRLFISKFPKHRVNTSGVAVRTKTVHAASRS